MKIVRVMDRLNIGGPAIHAILLTQHMPDTVLVYGQEAASEGNMLDLAKLAGIEPVYIPSLGREINPLRDIVSVWKLIRLIRKERPTVVHTHKSKAGVVGRIAAKLCGVPVIVHTYHGHVLQGYFSPLKSKVFIAIEHWLGKFSDILIAVSPKVKSDLVQYGIAGPDKITVTYLGLDLEKYAKKMRNQGMLRRELGLSTTTPVVGIVARLVPIKDIALFLETAKRVIDAAPEVHFAIVGDGNQRAALELLAQQLKINSSVHFLGFRCDVDNIYADLDVLVLTSANEGSPVSLIEGLASGCAVVSTNVGGVSDVITHQQTGILVPVNEGLRADVAQNCAKAILALLKNPAERERLGAHGRKDVLARFNIHRLVTDLNRLYLHALSQKVL